MWPFVGDYVRQILLTSVEPKVRESMPDSFKSFKFERIDLGDIVSSKAMYEKCLSIN